LVIKAYKWVFSLTSSSVAARAAAKTRRPRAVLNRDEFCKAGVWAAKIAATKISSRLATASTSCQYRDESCSKNRDETTALDINYIGAGGGCFYF